MASDRRNPYAGATRWSPWLSLLAGVAAALIMLAPAWLAGGRLQVPTAWDAARVSGIRAFALLPLDLAHVFSLFAMLVLGGVAAGLVVRMLRRRRPMTAGPAVWGVLLVQLGAALQSFSALAQRLGIVGGADHAVGAMLMDGAQLLYLLGLMVAVILGIAFAQLGLLLATRRSPAFAALAVALAASLVANWISGLLLASGGYPMWVSIPLRWLPAVIVGVALIWCGVRPWGRLVVWVLGLATLWIVPALIASLSYALNIRALRGDPQGVVYAITSQIIPEMLQESIAPVVVALVIGVVGTLVRMLLVRRDLSRDEGPVSVTVP